MLRGGVRVSILGGNGRLQCSNLVTDGNGVMTCSQSGSGSVLWVVMHINKVRVTGDAP